MSLGWGSKCTRSLPQGLLSQRMDAGDGRGSPALSRPATPPLAPIEQRRGSSPSPSGLALAPTTSQTEGAHPHLQSWSPRPPIPPQPPLRHGLERPGEAVPLRVPGHRGQGAAGHVGQRSHGSGRSRRRPAALRLPARRARDGLRLVDGGASPAPRSLLRAAPWPGQRRSRRRDPRPDPLCARCSCCSATFAAGRTPRRSWPG